jgi:hypothetical protein
MPSVLLLVLGIAFGLILPGSLLVFLIIYSHALPTWLYIVLTFLYYGLLVLVAILISRRANLRKERYMLGDELFFRLHPREWKRELKRWKDVDSYRVISHETAAENVPALIQFGYSASQEEVDRLGIALKARNGEQGPAGTAALLHETAYDELYYRAHPKKLKWELAALTLRRKLAERFTASSREPSLYEQRLEEIRKKIEADPEMN